VGFLAKYSRVLLIAKPMNNVFLGIGRILYVFLKDIFAFLRILNSTVVFLDLVYFVLIPALRDY